MNITEIKLITSIEDDIDITKNNILYLMINENYLDIITCYNGEISYISNSHKVTMNDIIDDKIPSNNLYYIPDSGIFYKYKDIVIPVVNTSIVNIKSKSNNTDNYVVLSNGTDKIKYSICSNLPDQAYKDIITKLLAKGYKSVWQGINESSDTV